MRFVPASNPGTILLGQPTESHVDVGAAVRKGSRVEVEIFSGSSVLDPGQPTGRRAIVQRLLSPLAAHEVGTIRCIGLNVC